MARDTCFDSDWVTYCSMSGTVSAVGDDSASVLGIRGRKMVCTPVNELAKKTDFKYAYENIMLLIDKLVFFLLGIGFHLISGGYNCVLC